MRWKHLCSQETVTSRYVSLVPPHDDWMPASLIKLNLETLFYFCQVLTVVFQNCIYSFCGLLPSSEVFRLI